MDELASGRLLETHQWMSWLVGGHWRHTPVDELASGRLLVTHSSG